MKPETKTHWLLSDQVERSIEQRLGRKMLLDHLSDTDLEQLSGLLKPGMASNEQLSKAVNAMLEA